MYTPFLQRSKNNPKYQRSLCFLLVNYILVIVLQEPQVLRLLHNKQ